MLRASLAVVARSPSILYTILLTEKDILIFFLDFLLIVVEL